MRQRWRTPISPRLTMISLSTSAFGSFVVGAPPRSASLSHAGLPIAQSISEFFFQVRSAEWSLCSRAGPRRREAEEPPVNPIGQGGCAPRNIVRKVKALPTGRCGPERRAKKHLRRGACASQGLCVMSARMLDIRFGSSIIASTRGVLGKAVLCSGEACPIGRHLPVPGLDMGESSQDSMASAIVSGFGPRARFGERC
jgi:hypothetical protein